MAILKGRGMIHPDGRNLVFITGCPRSGTTWLHRLIASHPLVTTGQESNLFDFYIGPQLRTWKDEFKYYDGRGPNGLHTYVTEAEFIEALRNYALSLLGKVEIKPGGVFLDKTPSHVCFLKEIHEIFPEAKIIIIYRHPVDVVASLLSAGKSWGRIWAPRNVMGAVRMWKHYVRCGMSDNKSIPSGQLYETNFEKIKENGRRILGEIFDFINLPYASDDLEHYLQKNRPGNPAMTMIPLYGEFAGRHIMEPEGFYKKKESDRHVPFFAKAMVNLLCLKEMWALGYNIK